MVGDFVTRDLSMGRVGLQVPEGTVIIDENLNVIGTSSSIPSITDSAIPNGVALTLSPGDVRVERTSSNVTIFVAPGTDLCGLCGRVDGTLVSSNGVILNDVLNQTKVNSFADSWRREPMEYALQNDRRECGK